MLSERRRQQWAPGRQGQRVREQPVIAHERFDRARMFRFEALEEESGAFRVRQVADERIYFFVENRQDSDILRAPRKGRLVAFHLMQPTPNLKERDHRMKKRLALSSAI